MTDTPDRIIRVRDLSQYTGLGKTKVKELIAQGEFEVITLTEGGRARGALASSVVAWQQRRRERAAAAAAAEASATPSPKPTRVPRRHLKKASDATE